MTRPRTARRLAFGIAAFVAGSACAARAEPAGGTTAPASVGSPRAWFGPVHAENLLSSERAEERLRGVERLVASGEGTELDRLVRGFDAGTPLSHDARARLVAMRLLAAFASRDSVRELLRRTLGGEMPSGPLAPLLRDTAALVLARAGDARSTEILAAAIRQEGPPGEAAERALLSYPPRSLLFVLGAAREPLPASMSSFLGRLGDLRAMGALRATLAAVRTPSARDEGAPQGSAAPAGDDNAPIPSARRAAALALAELGDEEQIPVARAWMHREAPDARLLGAEVLLRSGDRAGFTGLADVLSSRPELRARALALASATPSAELVPSLLRIIDEGEGGDADEALGILGRIGGSAATKELARRLADPARASAAAYALASAPGDDARRALVAALSPSPRPGDLPTRLAARAAIVRANLLGETVSGLDATLSRMAHSPDAADRAVAAFGLVALGVRDVREMISSRDPAVVRAAARAANLRGAAALEPLLVRLASEPDPVTADALGVALAGDVEAAHAVATRTLVRWVEEGRTLAPLAARVLAAREGGEGDGARERGGPGDAAGSQARVARLFASEDPVLRAHVARGLGASREPDSASRLAEAWAFEPSALVRRAIVRALSQRREPQRTAALTDAARFDPDPTVRRMADAALAGTVFDEGASEGRFRGNPAWVAVVANGADGAQGAGNRSARLLRSDGVALPVVVDPDGFLVVLGLPPGIASVNLASRPSAEDASDP